MCNFIVCGCRKACSCADINEEQSASYLLEGAHWSANPCRPWISTLFGAHHTHEWASYSLSMNNAGDRSHEYQRRMEQASNGVSDDKMNTNFRNFPTQSRRMHYHESTAVPNTLMPPPSFSIIGHPSLKIYRFRLPHHLLQLLDYIVEGCHKHAAKSPTGWMTYLYSLTKQDIALREIPALYEASRPITSYIKRTIERFYEVDTVRIDRNQPHVLKYSTEGTSNHTGVELHHDKCDLTANIMLSRSSTYTGGG